MDGNQANGLGLGVREKILESIDAAGKKKDTYFATIQSLGLGDFIRGEFHIAIVDLCGLNRYRPNDGLPPLQGILGPEVLSDGHAIIDCYNLRLFLYQRKEPSQQKR